MLPSGRNTGTCTRATGVGVAGAIAGDAAMSSPLSAQVLEASPVMLISLLSNNVERLTSAARSSTVQPEGTSIVRSSEPV